MMSMIPLVEYHTSFFKKIAVFFLTAEVAHVLIQEQKLMDFQPDQK